MIGEDVLSICFLAFVCLVFGGLVIRLFPDNAHFIIPSFALICIGLWISYDYILTKRYEDIDKCRKRKEIQLLENHNMKYHNTQIDEPHVEPSTNVKPNTKPDNKKEVDKYNNKKEIDKYNNKKEIDITLVDNGDSIQKVHSYMGTLGDTKLFNRMKYSGLQPQLAKDIRARYNKYSMLPYFKEELDEQENRIWWENDALENEL
jgi:hypothetical protein